MLVLGGDLVVHDLDDVADGDDADELPFADHRDLGDPPLAHLAHDSLTSSWMSQVIGSGVMTWEMLQPAEALAAVVDDPQNVALGEDADQPALVVDDRQRPDVVLHELGDRFVDRRLRGRSRRRDCPWYAGRSRTSMVHLSRAK